MKGKAHAIISASAHSLPPPRIAVRVDSVGLRYSSGCHR
jgi:hypothetical protein